MAGKFIGSGTRREGGSPSTHKQDFLSHVSGGDWLHDATMIVMNPDLTIDNNIFNGTTVQDTLNKITSFLNTTGQGFLTIGDGYDTTSQADFVIGDPSTPTLTDAFNTAFTHPRLVNGGVILVKAGTYRLFSTVIVPPGIVIMGEMGGTVISNAINEQSMFHVKRSTDRPQISTNGITTLEPINTNIFYNLVLTDDIDGYIAGPTMTTVPMVLCETGAYVSFAQTIFIGKMGALGTNPTYGRTKTLYAISTSLIGGEQTTLIFERCVFDGLQAIMNYIPNNTSDSLIFNDCKARVYGTELGADATAPSKNCFILISGTLTAKITGNFFNCGTKDGTTGQSYVSSIITFTGGNPSFFINGNSGSVLTTLGSGDKLIVNDNGTGNTYNLSGSNIWNNSILIGNNISVSGGNIVNSENDDIEISCNGNSLVLNVNDAYLDLVGGSGYAYIGGNQIYFAGPVNANGTITSANQITLSSATDHYTIGSRSLTRELYWLKIPIYGTWTFVNGFIYVSGSISSLLLIPLDIPNGSVLTGLNVGIQGASGHGGLPTMPAFILYKYDHYSNATVIASTFTDPSSTVGDYEEAHDIVMSGQSITIDNSLYTYYINLEAEGTTNWITGMKVLGISATFTVSYIDEG